MLVQDQLLESTLVALESAASDAEIVVTAVERVIGGKMAEAARSIAMLRATSPERPITTPPVLAAARV